MLVLSQALSDKEILQQTLNGLFEQNKLPDPTTIVPCIDDNTAHKLVVFIGQVLEKAAKGSVKDLMELVDMIKKFGDQIPQAVKDCLDGNAEFEALGKKYGIDDKTNSSEVEKKVITYVTLHYLEVHKELGDLNGKWKSGKYYDVGFGAAAYGHKILKTTSEETNSDKDTIQQLLNGAFEQNKLPDPTTIVPCIDDDTAHKIVVFAGQILEKAAKGSIADIVKIVQMIKDFGDQIPQSVKDCLDGNAEFQALGLKYGITNETNGTDIEKKVLAYVSLHYLEVHKFLGQVNDQWKAGKYYQAGFDTATYAHKILGSSLTLSDKDILQEGLNGAFEQNKMPDPKTIVDCGDDATSHKIVVFIGDVLAKAAKGSVQDLIKVIQMVKDFADSLPESTKHCLETNAEVKAFGLKYNIDEHTDPAVIEKKVISYMTFHYLEVHGWLQSLDSQWSSGKYYQAGFDGAADLHKVLGMTPEEAVQLRTA